MGRHDPRLHPERRHCPCGDHAAAHAPPEFADRSTLWNSVEQIEKARDSQLAREIEAALPRELSGEQQLALVRAYVKDNFVDKGMCADFAIHDKGTGNLMSISC